MRDGQDFRGTFAETQKKPDMGSLVETRGIASDVAPRLVKKRKEVYNRSGLGTKAIRLANNNRQVNLIILRTMLNLSPTIVPPSANREPVSMEENEDVRRRHEIIFTETIRCTAQNTKKNLYQLTVPTLQPRGHLTNRELCPSPENGLCN